MTAAGKALGEQSFHAHGVVERIAKNGEAISRAGGGNYYTLAPHAGLTKREHAAIASLQGIQANGHENMSHMNSELAAAFAVKCADALMDELAKDNK